MKSVQLHAAVGRALGFLRGRQLESGEFRCDRVLLKGERQVTPDSTPFASSLIASCLAFSDEPVSQEMRTRTCEYLLSQMEPFGVWRYWPPPNPNSVCVRPDLDDTASIASILQQGGFRFPDNRALILANRNRQGLFYTWIVPRPVFSLSLGYWFVATERLRKPRRGAMIWKGEPRPGDIDAIVNSNVLSYLGPGPYAEPICAYLIDLFKRHQEAAGDRWYQNAFVFYYAVARNFAEGFSEFAMIRDEMVERIVSRTDSQGMIGTGTMDTAHGICALMNLGAKRTLLDAPLDYLLARQGPEGGWEHADYYYSGPERTLAWGSQEITTAFCLQAMCRCGESL